MLMGAMAGALKLRVTKSPGGRGTCGWSLRELVWPALDDPAGGGADCAKPIGLIRSAHSAMAIEG